VPFLFACEVLRKQSCYSVICSDAVFCTIAKFSRALFSLWLCFSELLCSITQNVIK